MFGRRHRYCLARKDVVAAFLRSEPEVLAEARDLVRSVLSNHSPELRPFWDDLVGEVLLCTLRAAAREPAIRDFESYVARIAHCRAIDLARELEAKRTLEEEIGTPEPPSPVPEVMHKRLVVGELMQAAPPPYPRIWELVFFEERTFRDAALAMDLPLSTFHAKLRESLRWAARWLGGPSKPKGDT